MKLGAVARSLVTRIVTVGILLVVTAGVARYLYLAQRMRTDLIQVVSAQQKSLADAIARDLDYKLDERQKAIEILAAQVPPDLLFDPARLRPWLDTRMQLQPLFSKGIVVVDLAGVVRVDAPALPDRLGSSIAENRNFIEARAGTRTVGYPIVSRLSKAAVMPFTSPVRDPSGKIVAVMIGATELNSAVFLGRLQHETIGKTGGFLLISPRDHLFVSADRPGMVLQPTPPPGRNPMHDRAMAGYRGTGVTVNARGVEEIIALASVPSADWFVVARIPTEEALAAIDQTRSFIMLYSVIELLVAAAIIGILGTLVLRPLHQAAEQSKKMTDGQLPLSPLPVVHDDEVGRLTGAFNQLISKLLQTQDSLAHLAHHDALTGLLNRNIVSERIEASLSTPGRSGVAALFYIDLDGFKAINDEFGHATGDYFLKEAAVRLQSVTRRSEILARIGGDEFILFVPVVDHGSAVTREQWIEALAGRLIDMLSAPVRIGETERSMGASIGIALSDGDTHVDALMTAADAAMYEAKRRGRRRFVIAPARAGA